MSPVAEMVYTERLIFSLLLAAFNIKAAAVALSETAVMRADADSTLTITS
jgi:hypothetical protein